MFFTRQANKPITYGISNYKFFHTNTNLFFFTNFSYNFFFVLFPCNREGESSYSLHVSISLSLLYI